MKTDIYTAVTQRIVTALEAGTVPWKRPWKMKGGYPVSLSTGKHYRGINVLLLMLENYGDPRWGTYKTINEMGGQVRRGEKSTQIILWKPVPKKREPGTDEPGSYWLLRSFNVFCANQADGLPELPVEEEREFTPIELAEKIADGYVWGRANGNTGPPVMHGYDKAAYSPSEDRVIMPEPEQFVSDEAYYSTLFHELIHSTGSEKRLKRIETTLFGSDPYAKEELVAEIGASFLAGAAEFEDAGGDQSAAYVSGWLGKLKEQPKLIVQAAAQAQKAADLILGTTFDEGSSDSPEHNVEHNVKVGSELWPSREVVAA